MTQEKCKLINRIQLIMFHENENNYIFWQTFSTWLKSYHILSINHYDYKHIIDTYIITMATQCYQLTSLEDYPFW